MKTLPLKLDDDLDAALGAISAQQGQTKDELVTRLLRKYVETEELKRALQDPELAAEDLALAEQGMAEYQRIRGAAEQS
jgi:predicted transcriptional regulator